MPTIEPAFVRRTLHDERAGGDARVGVARRGNTVTMDIDASAVIHAPIDGWSRWAWQPKQPASSAYLFEMVDDADRPGLRAQDIDGLLDVLFLIGRQP